MAEFRALWLGFAQSMVGDQLARVALSILVFHRTGSAAWTAVTYALTFLPALFAGVLLSGLADRYPRREVMVIADLSRAALVGLMAIPGIPLPLLALLLVLVEFGEAPFGAAQGAVLPAILGDRRYEQGQRIILITRQASQVGGFAVGGLIVAGLGTHLSLAVNAVTFLASAALIGTRLSFRPVSAAPDGAPGGAGVRSQVGDGIRLIWRDRRLRTLVALAWLVGFSIAPEGLAAPLADQLGAGATAVGLLLAASPAGTVLGAFLLGLDQIGDARRLRWLGPLAIGANLPLVCYLLGPNLFWALLVLVLSGASSAYVITSGATFVRLTPDHQRGQALGLARSGLTAVQGIGIALGGIVAQWSGTVTGTIGALGVAGTLCAIAVAVAWSRADPRDVAATLASAAG